MDYNTIISKIKDIEEKKKKVQGQKEFESKKVGQRKSERPKKKSEHQFSKYMSKKEKVAHEKVIEEEASTNFDELVRVELERQLGLNNRDIPIEEDAPANQSVLTESEDFCELASRVDGKDETLLKIKESSHAYSTIVKKMGVLTEAAKTQRLILWNQKENETDKAKQAIFDKDNLDEIYKEALAIGRSF